MLHKMALAQAVPGLHEVFFIGGLKWARQSISPGLTVKAKPSESAFPLAISPSPASSEYTGKGEGDGQGLDGEGQRRSGRERGARESVLCL